MISTLNRFSSNSRTSLLCNDSRKSAEDGETSHRKNMEGLSISKSLVRSVSQKYKKKRSVFRAAHGGGSSRHNSSTCLGLYVKGGGCRRVGACDDFDSTIKRRFSAMDECIPQRMVNGVEDGGVGMECFSYGVSEKFWRRSSRKEKPSVQCPSTSSSAVPASLPDDVLEMILARLPLSSVMTARCVCKKWRHLTSTPHFIQMRSDCSYDSPWLFLFGITKGGCLAGDIHALDVSGDRWHRIHSDVLKGRFLFSVTSIKNDIYVVGGCSSSSLSMEKRSIKTHKGVLVFNPLSGSWRKTAPMKSARSGPVLGVFEVGASCSLFEARPKSQDQLQLKSPIGGVSDVYKDPHRLSVRLRLRDAFSEDVSSERKRRPSNFVGENMNKQLKFALIAVGGCGSWDEPLESGEIYDPVTDKWIEIASLPGEFGVICSGAICGKMFYVYSETDKLAGYDLERGFWMTIQVCHPPPRLREYYPKLIACSSRLFFSCVSWCEIDGQPNRREIAVRKLWELDFTLREWNEVSWHPDAPMDRNALFLADDDMIYSIEMFRIFGQVLDFLTACHVSETGLKWHRITKKHATHEVDASSCVIKSMLVLHL